MNRVSAIKRSRQKIVPKALMAEGFDPILMGISLTILCLGLVMIASASISIADSHFSSPFHYFERQMMATTLGLCGAFLMMNIRLVYWEKAGMFLLVAAFAMLIMVLIPGIGKTVNGSTRWIPVGILNLQVSEIVKLFMLIYVSGYLVRHGEEVRSSIWGFLKPMLMVIIVVVLLMMEPDFGASVVIITTSLSLMYLGGVRFSQFLGILAVCGAAGLIAIVVSPYRLERLTTFVNPWADPFNSGFQLTQSLIAIGSGGWTGTGLGGSVQKLFYLPEAHTDFLFAILAEELGLVGVILVIALFSALFIRVAMIARKAEENGQQFAAYLAYGIGIWITLQAFFNIGVNMGVLPTKGLTLPLMSYGGSSLIVVCAAIGLLLRIAYENNNGQAMSKNSGRKAAKKSAQKTAVSSTKRKSKILDCLEDAA